MHAERRGVQADTTDRNPLQSFRWSCSLHANASPTTSQMWFTLASLRGKANAPGRNEARAAFIRHKLLGKTLAVVHLMQARALSNVLWAMGKLQVDLANEGMGPYFASMVEERVTQLVDGDGLREGRVAAQLWYGLALSGCAWSGQLLGLMVERTVEAFGTWQLQAQGEVRPNWASGHVAHL